MARPDAILAAVTKRGKNGRTATLVGGNSVSAPLVERLDLLVAIPKKAPHVSLSLQASAAHCDHAHRGRARPPKLTVEITAATFANSSTPNPSVRTSLLLSYKHAYRQEP